MIRTVLECIIRTSIEQVASHIFHSSNTDWFVSTYMLVRLLLSLDQRSMGWELQVGTGEERARKSVLCGNEVFGRNVQHI